MDGSFIHILLHSLEEKSGHYHLRLFTLVGLLKDKLLEMTIPCSLCRAVAVAINMLMQNEAKHNIAYLMMDK